MGAENRLIAAGRAVFDMDVHAQKMFEPHGDSAAVRALDFLSKLGDQPEIRTIAIGLAAIGLFGGNDRLVRAGARMIIAHEAATFAKDALKSRIDRTRPCSASSKAQKKPSKGRRTAKEHTSFPSGHSAGAVAAARAFTREYPEHGAIALGAAVLVAASQIPRCAHYPSDVLAGAAIGLLSEAATHAAWRAARTDQC